MIETARVRAFVAGLEESPRAAAEQRASLPDELDRFVDAARAAWPDIALPEDALLEFTAARVSSLDALERMPAADLYLACACGRADPIALRAFENHFIGAIDPALASAGLYPDLFDEVKQRLRIKLFTQPPRILDYLGRGNLRAWLRVIAVREALDTMRSDRRGLTNDVSDVPLVSSDPELVHLKRRYRLEFKQAISEAAAALEPRERNLLRQYYLDGFTCDALARMYRVHLATVARWIDKARTGLLAETRRVLVTKMNIPRAQIDSILRLIESQLEVSARDLLE